MKVIIFLSTSIFSGCQSFAKNRCLFPFIASNETYYHCERNINGSTNFQCATLLEDDSLEAVKLEDCDMDNGCMWH